MYSQSVENARQNLKNFRTDFEPKLNEYFSIEEEKVKYFQNKHAEKMLESFKDLTMRGGKRLRASFVYYVYKLYEGKDDEAAYKLGCVLELIHAYLLAIDDFMDKSEVRRHEPTVHKIAEKYFIDNGFKNEDPKHFGESFAVLSGLTGSHMAMTLLNSLPVKSEIILKLYSNLNENITTTSYGQLIDVVNGVTDDATEKDVLDMLKYKTGVYTYENPMQSGAILAGILDDNELAKISEFAIPAGIAFQIQDDILGMFGQEESTGKSNTGDLKEGKHTLLIQYAFDNASSEQVTELKKHLGNPNATEQDHQKVMQILQDCGSLDYSNQKAQELVDQAKESLVRNYPNKQDHESIKYLIGIADYMIERVK